jgi:hypothetical protein
VDSKNIRHVERDADTQSAPDGNRRRFLGGLALGAGASLAAGLSMSRRANAATLSTSTRLAYRR